ncbi:MAG: phosphatase PAP2 family protein [Prevotella sp.]|nr:phosphatase PAP2 family protein [Prevotella sp.]MDD7190396.1 phosphatase PAP2 family protein [Prevotella sp.]MDY5314768.1 phosphatase PAP2 family protein [Prevotella sp.]
MREKDIIIAARVVSMVFTPFYLPLAGLLALFIFSYMSLMPLFYKTLVMLTVYLFTILLPTLLIHAYRNYQGWSRWQLGKRESRMVPYIIAIICYTLCYFVMSYFHVPQFMANILVAALLIQVVCAVVNVWWKISTHTAAIGGFEGALVAFSILFAFNPLWWFCVILVFAGAVGTSRMILRQHSLSQVVAGFMSGTVIGFWAII